MKHFHTCTFLNNGSLRSDNGPRFVRETQIIEGQESGDGYLQIAVVIGINLLAGIGVIQISHVGFRTHDQDGPDRPRG